MDRAFLIPHIGARRANPHTQSSRLSADIVQIIFQNIQKASPSSLFRVFGIDSHEGRAEMQDDWWGTHDAGRRNGSSAEVWTGLNSFQADHRLQNIVSKQGLIFFINCD
jgi:hypothetical protein